ncbi:MAG: type II secretion system F family protein [Candidatus Poribacteria bacterium]|nr:type II secretion system F family protein [Candidatus Poribacteria bacterium]
MGYWPLNIVEDNVSETSDKQFRFPQFSARVKAKDVEFFTYQMATLINAHITLPRALAVTLEQIEHPGFRQIVEQIKYDVEHGSTFHDALSQHPRVFPELYVNMVRAGESGAVLGVVLERLARFSERQRLLKADVISALFYPAILFTLSLAVIVFMVLVVIPRFADMFADLGVDLPLPTQLLIGTVGFVESYWWAIAIGGAVTTFGFVQYSRTESGKFVADILKLKLPLLRGVFSNFALVRFTRTMSTLLENGVLLLPALRVVKGTIGNLVYSEAIDRAEKEVEQGSTLARELQESAVFPPLVVHMMEIGEESGNPEQMLAKLADYYDLEVQQTLQRLTSSIGPLVILIMGVIVGLIAVAIILPVFRASTSLAG